MMQTTVVAGPNNNNNTLLGDCARLLVAARLPLLLSSTPEEEMEEGAPPPPLLTFEALNAALRQRPLLAAADRLFAALVAVAEARHHHGALAPPPRCHTRTLLTACMIEAHPVNVFEFPTEPLETALSAATAPFLRTLGRLVVAVATSLLLAEGVVVEQGEEPDQEQLLLRQATLEMADTNNQILQRMTNFMTNSLLF
jgi:hypothetical protein